MPSLAERIHAANSIANQMARSSLDGFLRWWTIDSTPPSRFASVCRPFQIERMQHLQGLIEYATGHRDEYDGPTGYWEICARGYDKSGSIARIICWAIAYAKNPIEVVLAASDSDQANIIYDAAKREAELNPWIKDRLHFKNKRIEGPGGAVKVLTADAPSSYGLRPDLIVCDELTWWPKRDLWDALFTAKNKRPRCAMVVISNAGVLRTWQHEFYSAALADSRWLIREVNPATNPTWMSQENIDRDKKLLPRAIAKRLYDNQWIDPSEDSGYLLRHEIRDCERPDLVSHIAPQPMCSYVVSVDYGPRRDRTVMSLMHQEADGRVFIDECRVLQGTFDSPVKIADVEAWIRAKLARFPQAGIIVDPYQLEGTIQRLRETHEVHTFQARGSTGNFHMAELLRTSILGQRLLWAPGCGAHPTLENDDFSEELSNLIVKVLPGKKYRFDHESGLHDDRACSVGMGLVALHGGMIPRPHLVPERPLTPPASASNWSALAPKRSVTIFGLDRIARRAN